MGRKTGLHLFTDCTFARTIWAEMSAWTRCANLSPSSWGAHDSMHNWWTALGANNMAHKKGLRSLIILVLWEIWTERNARIFEHNDQTVQRVSNRIKEQAAMWIAAGAKHLESFIYVV
uniref:Reverse transcriptase zinc-binding domain-containing protein n=1 Tax=Setaria viridis TaxID=4556 RepID=A0A4U6W935_SETVI|nr:hypothetical protein SEVIR_2G285100v2 [Setaria viridis]